MQATMGLLLFKVKACDMTWFLCYCDACQCSYLLPVGVSQPVAWKAVKGLFAESPEVEELTRRKASPSRCQPRQLRQPWEHASAAAGTREAWSGCWWLCCVAVYYCGSGCCLLSGGEGRPSSGGCHPGSDQGCCLATHMQTQTHLVSLCGCCSYVIINGLMKRVTWK